MLSSGFGAPNCSGLPQVDKTICFIPAAIASGGSIMPACAAKRVKAT